jgi:hypothetical protein
VRVSGQGRCQTRPSASSRSPSRTMSGHRSAHTERPADNDRREAEPLRAAGVRPHVLECRRPQRRWRRRQGEAAQRIGEPPLLGRGVQHDLATRQAVRSRSTQRTRRALGGSGCTPTGRSSPSSRARSVEREPRPEDQVRDGPLWRASLLPSRTYPTPGRPEGWMVASRSFARLSRAEATPTCLPLPSGWIASMLPSSESRPASSVFESDPAGSGDQLGAWEPAPSRECPTTSPRDDSASGDGDG